MASVRESVGNAFDYVLGRNTLIGVASLMLLVLSGYATWHGMHDFIVGVSETVPEDGSTMKVSSDVLVIGVVVALTFLMWLALREVFGAKRKFTDRIVMFFMYAFLALWSIGFDRKSSAPSFIARTASSTSPTAVITSTTDSSSLSRFFS